MSETKRLISNRMKSLQEAYICDLPNQIGMMESTWKKLIMTKNLDKYIIELIRVFHSMAGTASSFGYPKMGEYARKGESVLKVILSSCRISAESKNTMQHCIMGMKATLEGAKTSCNYEFELDVLQVRRECSCQIRKTVIIVDDDEHFLVNLSFQLECFGYEVFKFHRLQEVEEALPQLEPAGIIMDMVFPEGEVAGADAVKRLRTLKSYHIPVIFLSRRNDIHSRLAAVKAGSDAYFLKPVRPTDLIDKLDDLTRTEEPEYCRVLIVDDDKTMADYHAALLEQNGMETLTLRDSLQILDYLSRFNPDLILLDLNMPECNGYELAKLIRQVPAYFRIPIVFLSGEKNLELQMQAMATGGDDFITKPVQCEQFIGLVKLRAERMRMLRQYMERDGLSGLYNHSVMKQHIERLFLQAVRSNHPITLAMLDLDHFKCVNDTYGHITGDLVILSIARLLEQRLRSTDVIGRMGGEEFAIIMPNTPVDCAYEVMEEIRMKFESMCYESVNGLFHVTFSCGLAGFPIYTDPASLYNSADKALYKAKSIGRNVTYIAPDNEL
ncbi:MAG: response regulator receiver modulated diguanylate cyclase [Firmicutes bacterium]|nr:response regulator receiver modulated diguanylate cyclase [Bacillota bacterium]